jgi:hypothetical protein
MTGGSVEDEPGAEEREADPFRRRKNVLRADGPASAITWSHRKLAWTCRAIALALGLVQAWAFRYEANPDGVSYLDVADAYREGRWEDAPNGYWSPLYSWLLALGGLALRLPPSADFVLAHVINFVAFVAALVAFEYFLRGVAAVGDPGAEGNPGRMHDWWILGYALFVWAGLGLIGLGKITPDILLAAAAFSVAGVLIRIRLAPTQWRHAVMLGLFAGVGYLTKLAFLPLTGVLLGVALVLWGRNRRTPPMLLLCVACLALVAMPYAVALSRAKGRFTFGDTGRIAYAWLVNGVHSEVHWQGGPPSAGAPVHPTRQLSASPPAYEFATPLRATYPPWYDPSYWYEGVRVQAAPLVQARIAFGYLPRIFELHAALLLIVVATIVAVRVRGRALAGAMRRGWFLIVPGMAALVMYSTVLLDTRYVAPFAVMVWVGVLLTLEPFLPTNYRRGLWVGAATVLTIAALSNLTPRLRALLPGQRDAQGEYATFVLQSGVRPGDELALIGDGQYAYWARLARVRLVAEVPSRAADDFWTSGRERRRALLDAFRRAGAVAVVAPNATPGLDSLGWLRSPDGKLAVLPLGLGIPD